MSETTTMEDVFNFLDYTERKGFSNKNTVLSRKTACKKLSEILDENQRTPEYVRDNIEIVRKRFENLNKKARGATIDEYIRRMDLVLQDFFSWKEDRAAWEKNVASKSKKGTRAENKGNEKPSKGKSDRGENRHDSTPGDHGLTRTVSFPLRPDFDVQVKLPQNLITIEELQKIGFFLLPYCKDFSEYKSKKTKWPMLSLQQDE